MYKGKTKKLFEKATIEEKEQLRKKILERKVIWDELFDRLVNLIEKRKQFIVQETFYPAQFSFSITSLELMLENIEQKKESDPLASTEEFNRKIEEEAGKEEEFLLLKKEVEDMLLKLQLYEKNIKSNKQKTEYFLKKNDLVLSLSRGEVKKARKLLRFFRPKLK